MVLKVPAGNVGKPAPAVTAPVGSEHQQRKESCSHLVELLGVEAAAGPSGRSASNASRSQSSAEWKTFLKIHDWQDHLTLSFPIWVLLSIFHVALPASRSHSSDASGCACWPGRSRWTVAAGSPDGNTMRVQWRHNISNTQKRTHRILSATYLHKILHLLLHADNSVLQLLMGGDRRDKYIQNVCWHSCLNVFICDTSSSTIF